MRFSGVPRERTLFSLKRRHVAPQRNSETRTDEPQGLNYGGSRLSSPYQYSSA